MTQPQLHANGLRSAHRPLRGTGERQPLRRRHHLRRQGRGVGLRGKQGLGEVHLSIGAGHHQIRPQALKTLQQRQLQPTHQINAEEPQGGHKRHRTHQHRRAQPATGEVVEDKPGQGHQLRDHIAQERENLS